MKHMYAGAKSKKAKWKKKKSSKKKSGGSGSSPGPGLHGLMIPIELEEFRKKIKNNVETDRACKCKCSSGCERSQLQEEHNLRRLMNPVQNMLQFLYELRSYKSTVHRREKRKGRSSTYVAKNESELR